MSEATGEVSRDHDQIITYEINAATLVDSFSFVGTLFAPFPVRLLDLLTATDASEEKNLLPWGGGKHLDPGRHMMRYLRRRLTLLEDQ